MKHEPYESRREVIYISDDEPEQQNCCGGFAGLLLTLLLIGVFVGGTAYFLRSNCCTYSSTKYERRQTWQTLDRAVFAIEEHRHVHDGKVPNGIEGNRIVLEFKDAWGSELRYDLHETEFVVRSAGRDGEFNTSDDLTARSYFGDEQEVSTDDRRIPVED